MTLMKFPRAGLLALALGVVLSVFLSVAAFDASYAQPAPGAAPAAPAAAAPATPAAPPPACVNDPDPKKAVLEKCTPNSGDTAWMLTSVALVLMMTIPGLGLFYAGMVRKKNVGDTVMTSFAVTCLVTIVYSILTYSLAFTPGSPFIGGLSRVFLQGILSDISTGIGNPNGLAVTIPETVYMCFQMTFAIITPALIAGAFAERMKFSAMLWFMGLWAILVYAPIAHWVWGADGFMSNGNNDAMFKVLDFAGGTVVHINAGVAGLMCAIVLGKRKDTGPAHNMVLTFIGASLLWVGWFGFNAGSAVSAGMQAGDAPIAEDASGDADDHRADRADITRGRSDGDEASDRARGDTNDGRLAAMDPFHQHPGEGGDGGGDLRHGHCHASLHASADRRTSVEAEPADPK